MIQVLLHVMIVQIKSLFFCLFLSFFLSIPLKMSHESQEMDLMTKDDDFAKETDGVQKFMNTKEERAFVRKLNWKVLPTIFLIIFIQVRRHPCFHRLI